MKKTILLLLGIILALAAQSQVNEGARLKDEHRFFVGLSYSYLDIRMKLSGLTLHPIWYGTDMGSTDLNEDEIDEINSVIERDSKMNALCIQAGMALLDKPASDWKLDGFILLGISANNTVVSNSNTGNQEYSFNSGFSKPCLGLGFDLNYSLSERWGLSLRPHVIGSMGNNSQINDQVHQDPVNFIPEKKDKFQTIYSRGTLYANYTAGPVILYAGPGFYYWWSKHEYRRDYTNVETGEVITEETTSVSGSKYFIDGNIAVEWKINEPFTLRAHTGFGHDWVIDAGLLYHF